MKHLLLPTSLALLAASVLPVFAQSNASAYTPCGFSDRYGLSGMMGMMGGYGGWFFAPVFGWIWVIVWTANSILVGFLLWAWIKKLAKR